MKLRSRSVLAGLWLVLAVGVAFYTSWLWHNAAIDFFAFSEEGKVLSVTTIGYACAGFCLAMAPLYWYSPRLDRSVLNWLHFLGTLATLLFVWLLVRLAFRVFGPGSYYSVSGNDQMARELAQQQSQIIIFQFRAMLFLFAASQLMLVINLLTKPKPDQEDVIIQKMLDEL
ncbi:MAG: hypothetical protein AAFO03_14195 [Bacteroidota bacterium]